MSCGWMYLTEWCVWRQESCPEDPTSGLDPLEGLLEPARGEGHHNWKRVLWTHRDFSAGGLLSGLPPSGVSRSCKRSSRLAPFFGSRMSVLSFSSTSKQWWVLGKSLAMCVWGWSSRMSTLNFLFKKFRVTFLVNPVFPPLCQYDLRVSLGTLGLVLS